MKKIFTIITVVVLAVVLVAGAIRFLRPKPRGLSQTRPPESTETLPEESEKTYKWIDVHTHTATNIVAIDQAGGSRDELTYCVTDACLEDILSIMDAHEIQMAMLMPPPAPAGGGDPVYEADLAAAVIKHPDRFVYMGGGSVLNSLIHQTVKKGGLTAEDREKFEAMAQEIIESGARGFSEIAILHVSLSATHAFEEAPGDHELFLLLADIADAYNVPIDIHMDPILEDGPTPDDLLTLSKKNPATLQGNIESFETLLGDHPDVKIVWAHTTDRTGDLTPELVTRLLASHPNLYLSLRLAALPKDHPFSDNHNLLDSSGEVDPDWLDVVEAYPDQFMLGSDMFWGSADYFVNFDLYQSFLEKLPDDVAKKVACENAVEVYHLNVSCESNP